jgi:hypothetical protein
LAQVPWFSKNTTFFVNEHCDISILEVLYYARKMIQKAHFLTAF